MYSIVRCCELVRKGVWTSLCQPEFDKRAALCGESSCIGDPFIAQNVDLGRCY